MNILLVHGLGRTPVSMFSLASALRRDGHRTAFFGYSPTFESLPRILRRLSCKLNALGPAPVGLIGHSLGGLLLRMALRQSPRAVARFVMLGTPNRPPRIARWAWRLPPFRLWTRGCGRMLAGVEAYPALPPPDVPYTIIAGTGGPCGRFSPFGHEPNDSVVGVDETRITDADQPLMVPALHSFLMDDFRVRRLVLDMMKCGTDFIAPPLHRSPSCPPRMFSEALSKPAE